MTTFDEAIRSIVQFRDERDWAQFHTPRHLATGIGIEVAELQEMMLWKTDEEVRTFLDSPEHHSEVERELADIMIFALLLCREVGVEPGSAIERKLEENAAKYPVDLAKGNATKYDRLRDN